MRDLIRYQLGLLLRSQRWLPPVLLFAMLIVAGQFGGQQYGDSLGWCAGMLVPCTGWLTRTVLTGEPGAARACVAAASGPRRAQLAALCAALVCGAVLAVLAGVFEWTLSSPPLGVPNPPLAAIARDGGTAVLIGLLAGTALGALCAPPLLNRPATAVLSLAAASLVLLVAPGSPVNSAIRDAFTSDSADAATRFPALPLVGAVVLLAVAWAVAVRAAERGLPD
ncbi:ABC transporter [Streptacidiphilus sp. N1-3]|uniref:ABC transporter n=1 Tax=Streptacidiphilus alkalitolerans TaxID=3342712 RepID=A0ABV6X4Q4_9ACTN